jgi:hypothetical protein
MISGLGSAPYGTIWLDVETNPSTGCGFKDATFNCNFIGQLVSAVQA